MKPIQDGGLYPERIEGYLVEFEDAADGGVGAYVPELPGCVAAGPEADIRNLIAGAIRMHTDRE